jgi:TatD DNase family protein
MFHCFAGSKQMALEVAAHGFYLSFSAMLLFSPDLQEAVSLLPPEQILTETDSPALSPRRDQTRNEPAFIQVILSRLSTLLKYPVKKTVKITAANSRRFYGLPHNENT